MLTGAGGIINKAYGTVQLGGTNTYSGGTTLFSGTLEIAGQANIGSGDINFVSTSNQTPATLCLTNTSNTTITSAITINNLNGGVIQVAGDSGVATIISGVISGTASGNLTLQSEGGADNSVMPIIQLSGTNTFDGKTIVDMAHTNSQNMGYVMIAGDSNLGTGALELTSGGLIITNDTTIDNVVILKNSNHDLVIGSGKSVEFSGNMSGDTSFSIYSDGTDSQVIFSGTNTNAGGVSVSENATLTLSSTTNSAIADTANLGILLGTVILNQDSETIGNLYSNGGSLEIGSNTLTVSGSGDSIFDVSLVGSGNLVIQSNSNHTFTVNSNAASMSNFTGITTVNSNGKLLLGSGGNLSGAIIVDDTGLLTGDGTALGLVTVKSGGTLGAGNISGYATSVADIDLKGGLTAEAGSTLHFNIKGNTAGSTYDQLKVVGAVDIAGATLTVVDTTYAVTAGTEIVLISNDLSDSVTGTFSGLDEGATVTVNGVDMTIHYNGGDGNDVTLTAPVATANTVPVNTISESYTTSEDTVKSITDLTIADADNNTLSVTLSVNHGTINIANINTAADITVIDDNGLDGSISFSGSVDSINAMLADGVDYYAVANANGDNAATLTMTTSDGIADAVVDSAAVNISIINDAPTFNHSFGTFADDFSGGYYYDNADSYAEAYASALQPYGKLVSVGYAEMDGGDPYLAITRTHLDGTLDASFGHDGELAIQGYYGAESVAIQPDGNILIAGIDVNENAFIARFDEYGNGNFGNDGFIDVTDDTGLNSLGVTQVTLQPDGKILVAGTQNPDGGDGGDVALVRYNADGTLDTGFGSNGVVIQDMGSNNADDASAVAIDTNGKIVIAGSVAGDFAVSRFNADGTLDTSFNTTGIKTVDFGTETGADGLAIQSDSKIVAVGTSNNTADGDYDIALARFNTDGSLDTNFGTGGKVILSQIHTLLGEFDVPVTNGDDIGYGVTLDKEGNIYVSGQFSYIGENFAGDSITASFMAVAKYNSSGILDANFGNGGIYMPDYVASGNLYDSDSAYGQNILVQPDGKVVVTGGDSYPSYWNADINYSDFVVTRLDSTTGIPDSQFGYPVNTVEQANTTAFEEDGDAVTIGGSDYSDFLPTIYDVEQNALDNYSGGTLTVHRDGGANSEDLIRFDTSNSSAMTTAGITLEGTSATTGNIKHANQTFATFDTGTAGQLVIHFTSSDATQALVDAVTASISYKDTNNINPGYDAGEVNLAWTYNDGNDEEVASTTYIKIEGANDGDISGTVTVSGTPLTGSTLSAAGLDTIKDPDLVTADNPNGYVSENDMSFQWQVYDTQTSEWVNIDGAYNATFEVTAAENGLQIRVTVGYEDVTNGAYSELESSATGTPSGGGNSGGGNSGGGSSTPTPVVPEPVAPTPVLPEPVVPEPVAPTPTPTSPTIVDGVQVNTGTVTETRTTTDTNGNTVTTSVTTEQLIIPTVSETRTDSTGTTTTADIPLFWGESSRTEWATTANIPVGIGLVSEGSRAPTVNQTIASALGDLLYYIDTTTPAADMSKSNQLGGGSSFLDLLSNVSTLIVNKITLTNDSGIASHTPVTINGTANSITTSTGTSAPVEAIVIDASTLPQESYLNLQNIEFAVLVGDGITVRGGAGANIFFSGAGSQNIVLGKEDDILHAGAGDDIVGSVSGNDTVYGDEGNDTVFGGSGWDTLSGGEGSDAINGGLGYDTALQEGSKSDYSIQIANGTIVMTDKTSHSIDTLKDINEIHFNNGEILYVANNIAQQKILLALGHDKSEILYVPLIQTVAGTSANDTYQLADNLYGLSVDAKGGNDTLNVTGNFKDFRVEQTQTGVEITSLINGTMNELKNFESILFSDGSNIVIIDNLISLVGSHYPTDAIIG
ncbi:MAG: SBBP repeat-containing protein [Campylobacterales bacterium]|nr:SBBP repeat-containing protein [Campylobacterales bacterium]